MKTAKYSKYHDVRLPSSGRKLTRLLFVDILPTLLLLLAMAFGMAYIASKATDWPPIPEQVTVTPIAAITG